MDLFYIFLLLARNYVIFLVSSVAHPGCLSRIPDLDFTHSGSRISDPGSQFLDPGSKSATKERGEKKLVVKPFFVATNFTILKIILIFKC